MTLNRKIQVLLLVLVLMFSSLSFAEESGFYSEMPEAQRVTQTMETKTLHDNVTLRCTYPSTANAAVDQAIREEVDRLAGEDLSLLPTSAQNVLCDLDVGAVITRTGTSWMSFLILSEYSRETTMKSMRFETRVYDMVTGKQLSLNDIIGESAEALSVIRDQAREQLTAYYPALQPNEETLNELLTDEKLLQASFTLSPVYLCLTWRADALYEGKDVTLMHVRIPYTLLTDYMTQEALSQTDNSRYRMVALTFDDGPAGGYTKRLLNELRSGAAVGTFFAVGERIANNHYNVCREQNHLCAVESHSWKHEVAVSDASTLFRWKNLFAETLNDLTGRAPQIMRAPGGRELSYINNHVGLPLIHWSVISGDATGKSVDPQQVAKAVLGGIEDGDIVLMHDLNPRVDKYVKLILESLNAQGILCVTVEELFLDAGISLEADTVYWSTTRIGDVGGQ